jgi:hypothetical protein
MIAEELDQNNETIQQRLGFRPRDFIYRHELQHRGGRQ